MHDRTESPAPSPFVLQKMPIATFSDLYAFNVATPGALCHCEQMLNPPKNARRLAVVPKT